MTDALKTAQQVATELGISSSTLRRWSKDFGPFLSPSGALSGDGANRRFSDEDVLVLHRVKEQLASGSSTDEVAEQLRSEGRGETAALTTTSADGTLSNPNAAFVLLTDTLRAMVENQQTIQNSLQVNRNLQGVIIQDNFNLKEENIRLRERMLKMEQELSDLRKRDSDHRLLLEQRLAHLEQEMRKSIWSKLF